MEVTGSKPIFSIKKLLHSKLVISFLALLVILITFVIVYIILAISGIGEDLNRQRVKGYLKLPEGFVRLSESTYSAEVSERP